MQAHPIKENSMPMVGKQEFPYTKAGATAAKKMAKKTGMPMKKAAKKKK